MVKIINDTLRQYASHESSLDDKNAPPLSFVYSLFSVLCILISEEFDAALALFVENDAAPFISISPEGTSLDDILREAGSIIHLARHGWESAARNKGLKPVHTLTSCEMKLCLQERGILPHTLPAWKRSKHFTALNRIAWDNLLLTIDPFTPPDLAGKKVEAMLQEFQSRHAKEIEESWKNELKAGIVDEDFPARDADRERLLFDFRRAFSGNKKTRGEGTIFEIWLRRLEVYDCARRGLTSKEIGERIKHFKNDPTAAVKISQDKAQARAMIDAALVGIPISAVSNVRARRQ